MKDGISLDPGFTDFIQTLGKCYVCQDKTETVGCIGPKGRPTDFGRRLKF